MSITEFLESKVQHLYTLSKKSSYVLVQDNSSLNVWEECQRKFLYQVLMSLRQPTEKVELTFGTAFHKFLELWHGEQGFEKSVEGFLRVAMRDNTRIATTRQVAVDKGMLQEYSAEFGYILCKKYAESHPLEKEYFTILKDSSGKPYLETGFAVDLPNGTIIGLIDGIGIINYNKRITVIDHKTTKHVLNSQWFSDFNPNNQVSTYLYAASEYFGEWITNALINAVRVKDYKKGDPEDTDKRLFDRIETTRDPEQLEQRMRHANHQLGEIQRSIDTGLDGFPMHTQSCVTKYGECPFRKLCISKSGQQIQTLAESAYKSEPWQPYDVFKNSETDKIIDIEYNTEDPEKSDTTVVNKEEYLKSTEKKDEPETL